MDQALRPAVQASERDWLVPGAAMTFLLGGFALATSPNHSNVMPALGLLPLWMFVAAALAALCGIAGLVRMGLAGVQSPVMHIAGLAVRHWRGLAVVTVGMALAGLNMVTFMWAKPLLNHLVPFWADPLLANLDWALFLGNDPWKFLGWLNTMPMAVFYHRAWFAFMIITLMLVLSRPASSDKSALMLTYFLLWSVAGPVIHSLLPAGGPIFYEQLGHGDRFSGIVVPGEVAKMSAFLWTVYSSGEQFAPGSGISAMPSLHIATTMWMVMALWVLARRWAAPMAGAGILIFLLSISLGWHYAVDGIIGGAVAVLAYRLCKSKLERAAATSLEPQPTLVPAE